MLKHRIKELLSNPAFILTVYVAAALVATLLKISLDLRPHAAEGYISRINNFIIYRNSFYHLAEHRDLYGYFPAEQYDEFLYSPTFAALFAPFAILPAYAGVVLWCIFNSVMVFLAVRLLPIGRQQKAFVLWFILIELLTAIQNVQVNPLIAALFLFAFSAFERKRLALAAFCVVLGLFIKVFGILAASLFLLYPQRFKFIAYSILWTIVLFLCPLVCVSFSELLALYQSWFHALTADHAKNIEDVSVMRMLSGVSGIALSERVRFGIQLGAVALFCIKYMRVKAYDSVTFRYFFLASAMIWCIIFNHAAESSTYIIAIAGVALWYVHEVKNKWTLALLILAFVLCSLSPTDVFPKTIRQHYIVPMALKALPCFLIWLKLEYDMLFRKDLVTLSD